MCMVECGFACAICRLLALCSTPPEVLAVKHPVVDAILKAKTRKYAGTYKVMRDAVCVAAGCSSNDASAWHAFVSVPHKQTPSQRV